MENQVVYVDDTPLDEFVKTNQYAVDIMVASLKRDGITISEETAKNYLTWCYDVMLTSLMHSLGPSQQQHVRTVQQVVNFHCRNHLRFKLTGSFPPPDPSTRAPDTQVDTEAVSEPTNLKHRMSGYL